MANFGNLVGADRKTQDQVIKKTGKKDLRSVMCTDDAYELKDECAQLDSYCMPHKKSHSPTKRVGKEEQNTCLLQTDLNQNYVKF